MAQEVKLVPIQQGQGPSPWIVTHDGKSGDHPGNYPAVRLDTDSGQHFIKFQLTGNHQGITFNASDPIWVKDGGKPSQGDTHPQIPSWTTAAGGKELIVLDLNSNPPSPPMKLHYRLNFIGHDPLDPIIDNGGTNPPPPPPPPPPGPPPGATAGNETGAAAASTGKVGGLDAAALIIGLVIGIVIAVGWFKWGPGAK